MLQTGEKLYRTENLLRRDVAELQEKLREALNGIALDETTDFYDKLYALEATQRGVYSEYRTNPVVDNLDKARRGFVMLTASKILIIGRLVPNNPWSFLNVSPDEETILDLGVRFKEAYRVNDTRHWDHSSYGQSSWRSETAPSVEPITNEQLTVGLPVQPVGSENLYAKVESYAREIVVGDYAIHKKVASIQREKSEDAQIALHTAVTRAISNMS